MKVVDIEPGTDEWHAWRRDGIGASDIGVLLNDDPYRTPYQLWEKKCGYAKPTPLTGPMKHGIANEDVARRWINEHERVHLLPICIESEENCAFKASLDGWDAYQNVLMEIKCPVNHQTIENARTHSAIHKHWYAQIQWQMMIAKPERAYLAIYDSKAGMCILLQQWPDKALQEKMKVAATEFLEAVRTGVSPELNSKDYREVYDTDLELLLKEYEMLDAQQKEAKAKKGELRDLILSHGGGDNFKAYGWAVRFVPGRVSYDYSAMEQAGVDLKNYEKRGLGGYKITKGKGE